MHDIIITILCEVIDSKPKLACLLAKTCSVHKKVEPKVPARSVKAMVSNLSPKAKSLVVQSKRYTQ